MRSDLPHTLFPKDRKARGKGRGGKTPEPYRVNPGDKAFRLQREAYEKALARKAAKAGGRP